MYEDTRIDAKLIDGVPAEMSPEDAIKALQLCFAVYQASNERRPVALSSIDGRVSPIGWPPTEAKLRGDVEEMLRREAARADRFETR